MLAREGGGTRDRAPGTEGWIKIHELFDEFSLLGELEEEEDEDDEKFIPVSSGGFVAVFCPLKLFRHTGHVSCFGEQTKTKQEIREAGLETQHGSNTWGRGQDDNPSLTKGCSGLGLIREM